MHVGRTTVTGRALRPVTLVAPTRILEEVDRLRAVVEARLFVELGLDARPPFGHASPD